MDSMGPYLLMDRPAQEKHLLSLEAQRSTMIEVLYLELYHIYSMKSKRSDDAIPCLLALENWRLISSSIAALRRYKVIDPPLRPLDGLPFSQDVTVRS